MAAAFLGPKEGTIFNSSEVASLILSNSPRAKDECPDVTEVEYVFLSNDSGVDSWTKVSRPMEIAAKTTRSRAQGGNLCINEGGLRLE